jgi:hypothetical protein
MTPEESSRLIAAAGGPTKLVELLRLTGEGAIQRVSNWGRRGIPAAIQLEHQDQIKRLRVKAERAA